MHTLTVPSVNTSARCLQAFQGKDRSPSTMFGQFAISPGHLSTKNRAPIFAEGCTLLLSGSQLEASRVTARLLAIVSQHCLLV